MKTGNIFSAGRRKGQFTKPANLLGEIYIDGKEEVRPSLVEPESGVGS